MKSFKKVILIAVIGLIVFSGTGFAKLINGKVVSADSATRKLTLSTEDPVSGNSVKSDLWVNTDAGFQGIGGFGEIKKGDTLWVEAEADSEGNLRAAKITKG